MELLAQNSQLFQEAGENKFSSVTGNSKFDA
jgi:hypothetical protein